MSNMHDMNENLSLMNKINVLEHRQTSSEYVNKVPLRPTKLHNFTDYEVLQINLINKVLSKKLNSVNNTINNRHEKIDIDKLSKNVSK